MINNYSDIELFDRYAGNQMTAEERAVFEERLHTDKAFNEEYIFYKSITLGIKDYGKTELKDYLKEHGHGLTFTKKSNKTIAWGIAAVLALFIGVYAVSQFYSNQKTEQNIAITEPAVEKSAATDTIASATPQEPAKGLYTDDNTQINQTPEALSEETLEFKDVDAAPPSAEDLETGNKAYWTFGDDGDISVKSDKKLSDSIILAMVLIAPRADTEKDEVVLLDKQSQGTTQLPKSLNNNTYSNNTYEYKTETVKKKAQQKAVSTPTTDDAKKNGATPTDTTTLANANKPKTTSVKYTLEFWQSPVNFNGYKLSGNVVQLYGIDNNNIRLFNINQQLYLRIDKAVYILKPCTTGCPFTAETDPTIKNYILQQP